MILTGHQPNYLPYLGFFHKIAQSDIFVIVDTVQFVKRGTFGWMNRNKIRTAQGWQWLTVPVLSKGKFHQKIIDTKINNQTNWQEKHWKAIELNYKKAPFFHKYKGFFADIYKKEWCDFSGLSEAIIVYLIEALGIKAKVYRTSKLGVEGSKADLIINMCRKVGADTYLHGKHGQDYIDEDKFEAADIKCLYQDFTHPVYRQQFQPFIPNLSVIDLIFNHGDESLDILLGKKKISV